MEKRLIPCSLFLDGWGLVFNPIGLSSPFIYAISIPHFLLLYISISLCGGSTTGAAEGNASRFKMRWPFPLFPSLLVSHRNHICYSFHFYE